MAQHACIQLPWEMLSSPQGFSERSPGSLSIVHCNSDSGRMAWASCPDLCGFAPLLPHSSSWAVLSVGELWPATGWSSSLRSSLRLGFESFI